MRIVVVLLLAANLLYLGWRWTQPGDQGPSRDQAIAGLPQLELLAERLPVVSEPPSPAPPAAEPSAAAEPPPPVAVPQRQCYTLGPFAEVQIAELLAGALAEAGVSAAQRSLEQQEVSSYWVYLAPYPSRNQAIALTRELAGRGVSDYYVVNSGEFANAVSLGLFSEQPRAERRVAQIRALGYSPILAPRYRSRTVHWVDYEQAAGGPAADAVWRELAGPEVQRLDRSCPRS